MNNFCHAPWMHLATDPDGTVIPCCLYDDNNKEFANLNTSSIDEAMNHPRMIQLRKEFINGDLPKGCYKCKVQTEINMGSYRHKMNNIADSYGNITISEKVENFQPLFMDVRFTNLCNLKCRTCSPMFSSSIAIEHNKIWDIKNKALVQIENHNVKQVFERMDNVTEIYFAGGEPLISEQHYEMLNCLIEKNLNPELRYSTNLTNLKYKDKNLIDLWKHFSKIHLTVSIDGYKDHNDYIRSGSSYDEILDNILLVKQQTPHILISINSVASLLSMQSLPKLGKDLITKNLCKPNDMMFGIAHYPAEFDPTVIPKTFKDKICVEWETYIDWLKTIPDSFEYIEKCRGVLNYTIAEDNSDKFDTALERLGELDNLRKTSYKEIFKDYFKELKITNFFKSEIDFFGQNLLIWNINLLNTDYNSIQQELLRSDIWDSGQPQGPGRYVHNHTSSILNELVSNFSQLRTDILYNVYHQDPDQFNGIWPKGIDYYMKHSKMPTNIYKDTAGFMMHPHLDNHHVVVQVIINLQDNTGSTTFYSPFTGKPVVSAPSKAGEGIMFFNNANSIHGINGITQDRFILYSYIEL